MNERTRLLCQLMVGHHVDSLRDMTPIEIEACLNAWAKADHDAYLRIPIPWRRRRKS